MLDGSKARRRAVLDLFDHPVSARCQLHKIRNVQDRLPQKMRTTVGKMRAACHAESATAASLREGLAETLTVLRLGVPPTLARTLRSINCIESMISICRDHASNVKRWRNANMALRWCAAGMAEASKRFRRVNGHLHRHRSSTELATTSQQLRTDLRPAM